MFNLIRSRIIQRNQYIRDDRSAAVHPMFRGLPELGTGCTGCALCVDSCPSGAVRLSPLSIDLGRCVLCGECQRICREGCIRFTASHKISTDRRENLVISEHTTFEEFRHRAFTARSEIKKLFGRSLKLRSVSAGGCNGCEMELNACSNVNFDMGRFGIDIVASPKHADGIIITGPITRNMAAALNDSYLCSTPDRIVILMGTCAISGGIFDGSSELDRGFIERISPDIYVPGCPVHPLTFINGVLDFLGH